MRISEKELEDVIYFQQFQNTQDSGLLIYDHTKVVRQLSLGSFGTPDLVGFDFADENGRLSEVHITIYELKRGDVSFEALCQVQKYKYAVNQLLSSNPIYKNVECYVSTCLIGYSIDQCVDFMAASAELDIRLYTYESTAKGVVFNRIFNYKYKPDTYEQTWYGEGKKLNLFKLFDGTQEVKYDSSKNESWISHK
ncbi:hypothetical protein MUK70_11565 [Dyadobacter chenwenxiniae]|uniref:Uncharacterized protein n=1 Tax=Dyadobacter chenwenxiniae TaxID=2906456 RepID=A0A9X1TCB0_9BACT|nr:hypothetical protein [Dyadobacter chenwenxiniae]MCF0059877.1 hypothetical protein [Dyadobacter chenwenxiniae]UON85617.1 hypothetical protein MUK70_11565 [Dyadobacter chenwenxiniae]